jgi:membrane protease YdiL (CAAX protease family)
MSKNLSELLGPATSSGIGIGAGQLILNSVSGQVMIIQSLLSNALALAIFLIGCFAVACGLGQYLHQKKDTKKWSALASFSTSTISHGVLPLFVGSYMLSNAPYGSTVESVAGNYVGVIAFLGLIFLVIGVLAISESK